MVFSSEGAIKNEVREHGAVFSNNGAVKTADLTKMFEELETTGTVTLNIPNPDADGDKALLNWLKSGFTEYE